MRSRFCAGGQVEVTSLLGETIGLEQLPRALGAPPGGPARKWVVDPRY